jgi:hypothetical protein
VQSRRLHTSAYPIRDPKQTEHRLRVRKLARRSTRHRLTWFEAAQGVSFFAFVMLAARNSLVSGLLICSGIAMCVPAMIEAGVRGRIRRPGQLALAVLWAVIGTLYIVLRLS